MSATNHLETLHTAALDARNGYQEALKDAEGKGMSPLFAEMIAIHESHAAELAKLLEQAGVTPDPDGSFMSVVHRTIMDVRSLFSGLDESVLPGLIDGEKRNLEKYTEALEQPLPAQQNMVLRRQLDDLRAKIAQMEAMRTSK